MAKQDDEHPDELDDDTEDDQFDDEPDDELEPEEPVTRRPARPVRATAPVPTMDPARSDISNKWRIDRLDERERRFSFIAAAVSVALGVIIYVTETSNHNFRLAKGQLTPQTTLIIGLVAGALFVGATLLGRRAPVGFVALLTGAAFQNTSSLVLALPFFALAIWILVRSYKVQKEATATLRANRAAAIGVPVSPTRSSATRSKSPAPTRAASTTRKRSKGPATPTPNKRYTPKKPPPPPMPTPKLSRRQRKQSTTSD